MGIKCGNVKKSVFVIFGLLILIPSINAENNETDTKDICSEKWGDWDCSDWSKCSREGMQTRECILENEDCLIVDKPIEKQECECEPDWLINEGCVDGIWYIDNVDLNDCEDTYSEIDDCEIIMEDEDEKEIQEDVDNEKIVIETNIGNIIQENNLIIKNKEEYYCGRIGEDKTDEIGTDCEVICERLWTRYWHKLTGEILKGNVIINGTSNCITKQIEIRIIKKENFIDFLKRIFGVK